MRCHPEAVGIAGTAEVDVERGTIGSQSHAAVERAGRGWQDIIRGLGDEDQRVERVPGDTGPLQEFVGGGHTQIRRADAFGSHPSLTDAGRRGDLLHLGLAEHGRLVGRGDDTVGNGRGHAANPHAAHHGVFHVTHSFQEGLTPRMRSSNARYPGRPLIRSKNARRPSRNVSSVTPSMSSSVRPLVSSVSPSACRIR